MIQCIDILGVIHTIERYDPKDVGGNRGNMGMWLEDQCKILVSKNMHDNQISPTIWHEVMHCVLKAIGENDLHENEDFIEKLSRALLQVAKLNIIELPEGI